jgi:hypothetical protein
VCLIAGVTVQLRRTLLEFGRVPKAALVGLLMSLLLVATASSASHSLHQYLHQDGATHGHFCLVCSFAKGQVNAAAVALVSAVLVLCFLWRVGLVSTFSFPGFDYRTSPSRAPPRS